MNDLMLDIYYIWGSYADGFSAAGHQLGWLLNPHIQKKIAADQLP